MPEPATASLALPPGVIVNPSLPVTATTAGPVQGYRALTGFSSTRTDTPVERIPQSVSILPRSVIDDQKPVGTSEALQNVSGVVPPSPIITPAFDPTLLRGFSADRWVDGLSIQYNPGDTQGTINIERIEVLKGPTGFLYGGGIGNPVGGAVNIVSKLPMPEAFGKVGITIGSHAHVQPFFDINQPITPLVLFRMTGEYTQAKSHIDVIETERYNINPTLTLTDRSNTTLTVQGTLRNWKQPEYQGLPATGTVVGDFRLPRSMFIGPADIPDSHSRYEAVTVTLDHKLDPVWSFNVKGRIARSEFEENVQTIAGADGFIGDRPFFPPSTWGLYNAELFQDQQEATVTAHALAKFDWGPARNKLLFGFDYSRLKDQGFINAALLGFVDLQNPLFPPYFDPGPRIKDQIVVTETSGAFVQLQSSLWERLHITAGLRAASVVTNFTNTDPFFGFKAITDEDKLLPRAGAVLDVLPGILIFAGYSEGMRAQPFLNFVDEPKPELSEQVEGGIKFNFGGMVGGTLSVYEVNRHNVAITDVTDPLFRSIAVGEQRSRGFEAESTWQLSKAFKVLTAYAYTDAEFAKTVPGTLFAAPILAGSRIPGVPEHSGRVWLNYAFQHDWLRGFSVGAGVYAASDKLISTQNPFTSDGFYTIDAKIGYESERFEAALALKNITDEKYFDRYGYFSGRVVPSDGFAAYGTIAVKY
ncbi:MAG: TonB-dependent siderophore receptor [Hyphomicrobiaceae bacterium]|nr:TonB-dependent siderophore receptor [Hyphomicrobiaceae bacterium]